MRGIVTKIMIMFILPTVIFVLLKQVRGIGPFI